MQTITPFLWFDGRAEEAARFYTSAFEGTKTADILPSGGGDRPQGGAMSVTFSVAGQTFIAFNGGPQFSFSPAVSFFVGCDTQAEVDHLWQALSEGGETLRCGWLKDKFGLSWQIVPRILGTLLQDPDRNRAQRVMAAMLSMTRLDIDALQQAADTATPELQSKS